MLSAEEIPWKALSPSAAVKASHYRVPLPGIKPDPVAERISAFMAASQVLITRTKKKKVEEVDLRPDVLNMQLEDDALVLELVKGSPLLIASYVLETDVETVRRMNVRKTGIVL